MADDARLDELRGQLLTALEVAGPMTPYMERLLIGELLPVVSAWAEQHAAQRAADALMWSAWTVAHSPGIKHQANAVNEIRARATALTPATEKETT
jgi:hypothetical protein